MIDAIESVPEARRAALRAAILRAAVAAVLVAVAAFYAYSKSFSTFMVYDDEGYMAETFNLFASGNALYDAIPTPYGPAHFSVRFLIHRALGVPLTSEGIRWVSILIWIATAGVLALAAWRATRRPAAALLAFVLAVVHLSRMVSEPGHPQDLCGLLLALAAAVATWAPGRPGAVAAALGASAAWLVLTKVNVGIFAGLALLLALMASAEGRLARWAWAALSAAAVALPFLLMRRGLWAGQEVAFACVAASGILAMVIASASAPRPIRMGAVRVVAFFAGGFVAGAAIPVAFVVSRGTTPYGLIDAILLLPLGLVSAFALPVRFAGWGVAWGAASVAMSAGFLILSRRPSARGALETAAAGLKAALGLVVLVGVKAWVYLLLNAATPMPWLVLAPVPPRDERPGAAASRMVIGFLAALQILQAYPIAGSQLHFGSLLYVLIAAICLDDAARWAEGRCGAGTAPGRLARLALPALAAVVTLTLGYRAERVYRGYRSLTPMAQVGGHGLGRIRIRERQVATYRWLVSNLSRFAETFQCTTGFNSLYLWTGIKPPTTIAVGHAIDIFTDAQQESIVAALRRSPNACIISNPGFFQLGARRASPFLEEVARSYVPCGEVDRFEFRVRAGRPLPALVDCVRPEAPGGGGMRASLTLTPVPGRSAHRACVVDTADGSTLADTRPSGGAAPMRVEDGASGVVLLPPASGRGGLDLSVAHDLALALPPLPPSPGDHFLVLRLLGPDDEAVVSLPFLGPAIARPEPAPQSGPPRAPRAGRGAGEDPESDAVRPAHPSVNPIRSRPDSGGPT